METSFTDLRNKEVINVLSGRLLGNVNDIIIDCRCNCVIGLMVPGCKSFFSFFKPNQEIFIPMSSVCKIGEDVILVEVIENNHKKKKKPVRIFDASQSKECENMEYSNNNS